MEMEGSGGIERRKYVRIPFSFILRYRAAHAAHANVPKFYTVSITKNISVGGLLFPTTTNILLGTELEIELNLAAMPQESSKGKEVLAKYKAVQVRGRVVRTEEIIKGELYNVGFVIEDIDQKERHTLEHFVDFFLKRERLRNKFKFGMAGKEYIGPERRKYFRVPYTFLVKYSPAPSSYGKSADPQYCLDSNISACGLLLETHEKFDLSSLLDIELVIPAQKDVIPIKITGRVVRTEELIENELYETGVGFEKIEKKDQAALYDFLMTIQKSSKKNA